MTLNSWKPQHKNAETNKADTHLSSIYSFHKRFKLILAADLNGIYNNDRASQEFAIQITMYMPDSHMSAMAIVGNHWRAIKRFPTLNKFLVSMATNSPTVDNW